MPEASEQAPSGLPRDGESGEPKGTAYSAARLSSPKSEAAPAAKAGLDDFRFGAIAVWGGLLAPGALEEALAEQSAARSSGKTPPLVPRRLGEVLVRRGGLTEEQVRRILKVQLQRLPAEGHLIFGQIAEAHRFVSPEDNRRALDIQSREILADGRSRLIADILIDMGAIDREAADAIISYQARGDSTHMSETRKARVEGGPAPAPARAPTPVQRDGPAPRQAFLPRGKLGFIADHSTWLVIAAAVLFAVVLIAFKERILGGPKPPPPSARLPGRQTGTTGGAGRRPPAESAETGDASIRP